MMLFKLQSLFLILSQLKLVFGDLCEGNFQEILPSTNFLRRLKQIQGDCGEVCDTSVQPIHTGKYYDFIEKNVDCLEIFESLVLDGPINSDKNLVEFVYPPRWCELPDKVKNHYNYQGRAKVSTFYISEIDWSTSKTVWSKDLIEEYQFLVKQEGFHTGYGPESVMSVSRHLKDHMADLIQDGHILVIGTQKPWIEAILLNMGASNITTLDYNPIISEHPKIRIISPKQLNEMGLRGEIGPLGRQFDGVVSYSSLEHSGLGRYGDALNPWGDLITMAKAWCLTKSGGKAAIAVPTGNDEISFNIGRSYGHIMYPHLFANWEVTYTEAKFNKSWTFMNAMINEPVHILLKH